jgi:hypothetical protein
MRRAWHRAGRRSRRECSQLWACRFLPSMPVRSSLVELVMGVSKHYRPDTVTAEAEWRSTTPGASDAGVLSDRAARVLSRTMIADLRGRGRPAS